MVTRAFCLELCRNNTRFSNASSSRLVFEVCLGVSYRVSHVAAFPNASSGAYDVSRLDSLQPYGGLAPPAAELMLESGVCDFYYSAGQVNRATRINSPLWHRSTRVLCPLTAVC